MSEQEMARVQNCPQCGGAELYARRVPVNSGCGIGLLPRLGSFLH
jgi:hypothetical protein